MRKLAVVLGGVLVAGAPFGAHALAAQKADPTCVTIPVAGQQVCVPPAGVPELPPPNVPQLPPPNVPQLPPPNVPQLPPQVPQLPPPNVPQLPPQVPPSLPGTSSASLGSGCTFQSQQGTSPTETTLATLPDGTRIYTSGTDPTTLNGYAGGTGPHGTLEGGGSITTGGVSGQIGGHSNDAPLDGYGNTSPSYCVNGNSLP